MSGHSKWHNIKNKKGKEDARRAKEFTKIARLIIVSVREGGDDPNYNSSLKTAIEKAKAVNMPNDNIERAIKKGAGNIDNTNYEEVLYEGYGPSGAAVLVSCLTDNRNRTAPDVRHAFDKHGGNLGQSGSVSFLFERKGVLVVEKNDFDPDELVMTAIDLGAEDVEQDGEGVEIITAVETFSNIRDTLSEKGYSFAVAELNYIPSTTVKLNEEDALKMEKLIDMLEDNDDVQGVYHNWEQE